MIIKIVLMIIIRDDTSWRGHLFNNDRQTQDTMFFFVSYACNRHTYELVIRIKTRSKTKQEKESLYAGRSHTSRQTISLKRLKIVNMKNFSKSM